MRGKIAAATLASSCAVVLASCTGGSGLSSAGVTASAPRPCGGGGTSSPLHQVMRVRAAAAPDVVQGHLPGKLPPGFGLQEVDRVDPGHGGYVAWTDAQCRRVALSYTPGETAMSGPTVRAFGPWRELQRCGEPRPCLVWQSAVNGGLLTFFTWRLAPRTATAILRTVRIDTPGVVESPRAPSTTSAQAAPDFEVGYVPPGFHRIDLSSEPPPPAVISMQAFQADGSLTNRHSLTVEVLTGDAVSTVSRYAKENGRLRLVPIGGHRGAVGWNVPSDPRSGLHVAYVVVGDVAVEVVELGGPDAARLSDDELVRVAASVQISA